ncbi:MAG: TIGR04211 family SH3 domain-containing protein [Pseudomonadota bacterium]
MHPRNPHWLILLALLVATGAHAQSTRYVSDQLVIGVRSGPGDQFGRVANIGTGDSVTVLEAGTNGYVRIGLSSGVEGWVQGQYLTDDPPASARLKPLERESELHRLENERLLEVNRALELDNAEMKDALGALRTNESSLKTALADAEARAEEAAIPQSRLDALTEESDGLKEENRLLREHANHLKERRDHLWFAIGGGVSFLSLLVGLLAGRAGRKRTSGPTWR